MLSNAKFEACFEPLREEEPNELEKLFDESLKFYMDREMKLESAVDTKKRETVLSELESIFGAWVKSVAKEKKPDIEDLDQVKGSIFLSGSYRLGVRDIGADIDTVCVAPSFCGPEDFFGSFQAKLCANPNVTNYIAVPGAAVPLMSFDFRNVSIDFLFAQMPTDEVPRTVNDILDDNIVKGLSLTSEKSLNGPRVTNIIREIILRLNPKDKERSYSNFLIVLRFIRRWAKVRGIYGNKFGYLGGVNCNLLVAQICQLYPLSSPSVLLEKFFHVFRSWKWPKPVMLNRIQHYPNEILDVWSEDASRDERARENLFPIITPAYPAMNSSGKVSEHSRTVMVNEFARGDEILKKINASLHPILHPLLSISSSSSSTTSPPILPPLAIEKSSEWGELFEPSDFFLKYDHYLCCHLIGASDDSPSKAWVSFLESRIRSFAFYDLNPNNRLPIQHPIHLSPQSHPTTKSAHSICYFIGFNIDYARLSAEKTINFEDIIARFLIKTTKFRNAGSDFQVEHMRWRQLPLECVSPFGGSRESAKEIRERRGYGQSKRLADLAAASSVLLPSMSSSLASSATSSSKIGLSSVPSFSSTSPTNKLPLPPPPSPSLVVHSNPLDATPLKRKMDLKVEFSSPPPSLTDQPSIATPSTLNKLNPLTPSFFSPTASTPYTNKDSDRNGYIGKSRRLLGPPLLASSLVRDPSDPSLRPCCFPEVEWQLFEE